MPLDSRPRAAAALVRKTPWWVWLLPLPVVWWAALAVACRWQPGMKITALLDALNSALAEPFVLAWVRDSPRFLLVFTVVYTVVVIVAVTDQKNTRPGAEHGSAAWGDVFRLNKFYMDRHGPNLLLTQHIHIGIDGYKHKHNTNILIVGGSGAGKTRTYGVPNVLECACSMVITDPKAEILRKTGNLLKQKGYEVIVFDLINPAASFCYNPFVYVHDDREVLTLIENLIRNTTPSHSKSSDPFWEKSETALLQALMLYLLHEAPPEEQNFSMVMEMIAAAEVHEDDDNYQSPLDILFERLEMREPDSIACKQYRIFKQAAGKTAKSILVSVGVRLAAFNLPSIAKLTMTDELHLQELGERKIALFCCIPDSDKPLNYLVGMIYTQLIQTLYRQADRIHKGRLPVPVHCLMDEYANISLPKDTFLSALATMRSRAIFCSIIVQNMAQLKAMYKDDWESLVGLCDEFLYLGGTEKETHKYVSEARAVLTAKDWDKFGRRVNKGAKGIKLAFAIVNNTKPKDAPSGGDKFWDDSSVLLISALILYLMYEAPASEQNFSTLMYMILNCQVSENEMVENPLMMLFGELERRDPQHPAVLQFKSFMLGAKKTLQSILISAAANLYMFNSRKFAEMTSRDEMFLPRMGLEQRALFIVLPDNDTTFNFIATMLYTQLFDQLFRLADSTPEYNGALPVHVRLMMDEFANVALPKNFKNILAVCRSRNISCDIILQNIAQLKSLFKDDWEGIIGNCDTLLYLGGNEYGTYEYLSKILGKETERTKSQSIGKGSRGSSSDSLQTAGRELCMPDEIRRMRDDECLLLMRSEDPVIDKKYNLLHHPNVKYTPDAGGEPYVIPPDYMGDAVTITMDAVAAATAPEITEEMYEQLDYLEKHPEENYYENEENFSQYDQGD